MFESGDFIGEIPGESPGEQLARDPWRESPGEQALAPGLSGPGAEGIDVVE